MINWLLNIPNNNTCIFRSVFYLGFLWFSILLIILISSLNNNIRFTASGIFIGLGISFLHKYLSLVVSTSVGISPLDNQDFYAFLFMWAAGFVLFIIALKNFNLIEHFPI
jgi:hypothetical protein